jgi:hypothetical protein
MYPMHPDDADFTPSSAAEIDRAHARSGCDPDADKCRCRGHGWVGSERDAHYTCLYHFADQPHPEDYREEEAEAYCVRCENSGSLYVEGFDGLLHLVDCECRLSPEDCPERIQARQAAADADRFYSGPSGRRKHL